MPLFGQDRIRDGSTEAEVGLVQIQLHILRVFLKVLGHIPYSLRCRLGRGVGRVIALIPSRERRIARLQLELLMPQEGGKRNLVGVYSSLAQTGLETINLTPVLEQQSKYVDDREIDLIPRLLLEGKSVLALSAHAGNWDLLAACIVNKGVPLTTIGREARSPITHEILSELRHRYGIKTLWRDDGFGTRQILREIKGVNFIAALIDQDTKVVSQFSPFFGIPASTPSSLVALAKRNGSRIISAFLVRTGLCRYKVHMEELPSDRPVEQILDIYHQRLEALIRKYPDQWVWVHKRWRTLPSGERLSSAEYIEYLTRLNEERYSLEAMNG